MGNIDHCGRAITTITTTTIAISIGFIILLLA